MIFSLFAFQDGFEYKMKYYIILHKRMWTGYENVCHCGHIPAHDDDVMLEKCARYTYCPGGARSS